MTLQQPETVPKQEVNPEIGCTQRLSSQGRIFVSRKVWVMRILCLIGVFSVIITHIWRGFAHNSLLIILSTLLPLHASLIFIVGWFLYKQPLAKGEGSELVSVIIPIYNQESMISIVIDAIFRSTYSNIEVIAVNDGSKDGTKEILDSLAQKYANLKVIHKRNQGKRKAVATGFFASRGRYILLIDSDSIVESHAIAEFMRVFNSDGRIGAAVGHVKVWNANKNFLTRCQDAWYDFSFNISKACESFFGSVLCCSGCLAAYRREAIDGFISYWAESEIQFSDDRQLSGYVIAPVPLKTELHRVFGSDKLWVDISQKLMESTSRYDDAEDRGLTAHALIEWKAVYVASATAYTDVPEKWKGFLRQQLRWKKGTVRTNFFVSGFFWLKNPLMALIFYTELMTMFTAPLILLTIYLYVPLVLQDFVVPTSYFLGQFLIGLAAGLDYKGRDRNAKNWMYKPLMNLVSSFILVWLIFPALWTLKKNAWLTR